MEKDEKKLVLFAEETKVDLEHSEIFQMITFKLFDNTANRNKQGVTSAFISSIVNNEEKYAALPLYADVSALLNRNYRALGHKQNPVTKTFGTTQIGSLVGFQMVAENDGVVSQLGTARIPKREAEICERIAELYEMGNLNVSFEIRYSPDNVVVKDGVCFVDAADENVLTGMAVVWTPAYADANALDMVAEANADSESDNVAADNTSNEGDEKEMPNENEVLTSQVEQHAEYTKIEETAIAEDHLAETVEAKAETEENEEKKPEAKEEKKEEAQAEILHQSVEVTERIEQCGDEEPVHIVEERAVVVETLDNDPGRIIAEKDAKIAELENQIAELNKIKAEYDRIVAEAQAAELEAKKNKAKAFAEKQGLDTENEKVAEAIASMDFEAIASLAMENEKASPTTQVASYVIKTNMEINSEYGGLLERRK